MSPKRKSHPPAESGHEPAGQNQLGLERLVFFNDAVFAIAITLLALDIRLPAGIDPQTDTQLLASLLGMWQKYLAYALSFLVIGSFWIAHHRKFRLIRRYDNRLLGLNLLVLMVIAFIPFPSALISESGTRTATIAYALTMTLAGLLFTALWGYASWRDRLTEKQLSPQQRRREFRSPLATTLIFLVSIVVAYLDVGLARLMWVLILPASLLVNRG